MATKRRIFCGKTPTTEEHIFPVWVNAILKHDPRKLDPEGTHLQQVTSLNWYF